MYVAGDVVPRLGRPAQELLGYEVAFHGVPS